MFSQGHSYFTTEDVLSKYTMISATNQHFKLSGFEKDAITLNDIPLRQKCLDVFYFALEKSWLLPILGQNFPSRRNLYDTDNNKVNKFILDTLETFLYLQVYTVLQFK